MLIGYAVKCITASIEKQVNSYVAARKSAHVSSRKANRAQLF